MYKTCWINQKDPTKQQKFRKFSKFQSAKSAILGEEKSSFVPNDYFCSFLCFSTTMGPYEHFDAWNMLKNRKSIFENICSAKVIRMQFWSKETINYRLFSYRLFLQIFVYCCNFGAFIALLCMKHVEIMKKYRTTQ